MVVVLMLAAGAAWESEALGLLGARDDLVGRRVDFADSADLDRYYTGDDTLPARLRLNRPVGAGELLPRSALEHQGSDGRVQLPINVENGAVSKRLSSGAVVDVYVSGGRHCAECAGAVLAEVPVTEVDLADDLGTKQVVLAVDQDQADRWFALIGTLDQPAITIAEVG